MDKRLLLLPALLLASSLCAMDAVVDALVKPEEGAEETLPSSAGISEAGLNLRRFLDKSCTEDALKNGLTALHFASQEGDLNAVKSLIEKHNALVDAPAKHVYFNPLHFDSYTPLHFASREGHLEVAKYLIVEQKARVDVPAKHGRTPLHLASLMGHLEVVKCLIEEQGAQVDVQDFWGKTPLHWASEKGHLELVKYLIEEQKAQVDVPAKHGCTPLHWASLRGHLEVVRYLIERGALPNLQNSSCRTPMDLAKNPEIVKLLAPKSLFASYAAYPVIALGIAFMLWLAKKHVMDSSTENDKEKTGDASELGKAENETYSTPY